MTTSPRVYPADPAIIRDYTRMGMLWTGLPIILWFAVLALSLVLPSGESGQNVDSRTFLAGFAIPCTVLSFGSAYFAFFARSMRGVELQLTADEIVCISSRPNQEPSSRRIPLHEINSLRKGSWRIRIYLDREVLVFGALTDLDDLAARINAAIGKDKPA